MCSWRASTLRMVSDGVNSVSGFAHSHFFAQLCSPIKCPLRGMFAQVDSETGGSLIEKLEMKLMFLS